jgi:hypothetical protein
MRLAIALFCILWASMHSAAADPGRPRVFNVRTIPLGMTMAQFRAMPFPDRDSFPTARTFCSDDPGASGYESLQVEWTLLQAGIIKCGYFYPEKSRENGQEQLSAASIDFFGEAVSPLFLFLPNLNASALIVLFHRAYGAPTSYDVSILQMGFGLELANISYVWAAELSSIKVDTISFVLNQMSVVFIDNRLWGDLHERLLSIENVNRMIAGDQDRRRKAASGATILDGDAPEEDPNERPGLLPGLSEPDPDADANAAPQ